MEWKLTANLAGVSANDANCRPESTRPEGLHRRQGTTTCSTPAAIEWCFPIGTDCQQPGCLPGSTAQATLHIHRVQSTKVGMIAIPKPLAGRNEEAKNVLGGKLAVCSESPKTGFFRDGCCNTSPEDTGSHTVCCVMTAEFLAFSKSAGNDLSTPMPQFGFPGLKPGDRWCLCAPRWQEALDAGFAPQVVLEATHEEALAFVDLDDLKAHAVDR